MDSGSCIGGNFVGECEYCVLRHIKLLKGHFSEYIENASDHVIDLIQNCCNAYLGGVKKRVWKYLINLYERICLKYVILIYQEMKKERY